MGCGGQKLAADEIGHLTKSCRSVPTKKQNLGSIAKLKDGNVMGESQRNGVTIIKQSQ